MLGGAGSPASLPPSEKVVKIMLNTMAIQLLVGAKNWEYVYFCLHVVVYKATIDGYAIVLEVEQNHAIIYDMSTLIDLLDSGVVSIRKLIITQL